MKYVVLALTLLMLSPSSFADFGGKGKRGHRDIIKKLDLSDEQKEAFEKLREEIRPQMKALKEAKKELHGKMQEAMKNNANEKTLQDIHTSLNNSHNNMADLKFKKMLQVRQLLNDEQRTKYFELMDKKRRKGRKGKRD